MAIIRHAQGQIEIVNGHIADINAALEAESPGMLRTAARALRSWANSELAWLESNPATPCVAVPYGYYQDVVDALKKLGQRYLDILNETDPEVRGFLALTVDMQWDLANGALQLLQTGLYAPRSNC